MSTDVNTLFFVFDSDKTPPEKINRGPFSVFAMIDGHKGSQVA